MIRVFDFETTGFDPVSELFGISGKMPPDVRAVHHIHGDDLQGLPFFAPSHLGVSAVYAAHNAKFELQFVTPPTPVICTYKAGLRIWPDAYVTAHILRALTSEATTKDMIQWTSEPAVQSRIGFGKHRGQSWTEVDDGYLRWVLGQDFDEDTKWNVQRELERRHKP